MRKILIAILAITLTFLFYCGKTETSKPGVDGVKTEIIDGIKHVYNTATPLKGVIRLEMEKRLEIDSQSVKPVDGSDKPALFLRFKKDNLGNTYIYDYQAFNVYKFSKDGTFLCRFLRQGEGPGEFKYDPEIVFAENNTLWLQQGLKIAKFDGDGKFLEEKKLPKAYRLLEFVDENRFIGVFSRYKEGVGSRDEARIRVSGLLGTDGTILKTFLEVPKIGLTILPGKPPVRFYHPIITPDILHAYSHEQQLIYITFSKKYEISVKDLQGKTRMVIHRDYNMRPMKEEEKKDILGIFRQWPEVVRARLRGNLPESICIFRFIKALPNGYIGCLRYVPGQEDTQLDIFNKDGIFVYTLQPSAGVSNLIKLAFLGNGKVATIENIDERDIYVEYKIKNHPNLFE
ncbi:MAG: 6-bladed beta-propeller [bacterium]|nr:6-bladed beta-propeller [bacterium]